MGKRTKKKNRNKQKRARIMFNIYWDCCNMMDGDLTYRQAKAILEDVSILCACKKKDVIIEREIR